MDNALRILWQTPPMISTTTWAVTIAVLVLVLLFDLMLAILRRNKETTLLETGLWTVFYVSSALAFGFLLPGWTDEQAQKEFFAGWLTEYALSVDNVFVFVVILNQLRVKKEQLQLVLLLGIIMSIAMRGVLIPVGAVLITRFSSIFFLFGAFLIYTAIVLYRKNAEEDEWKEGRIVTKMKARGMSTFAIAIVALAFTDLAFAVDSIPAIFGLTKNPYIVITANAFALMGLRQLYFLLKELLKRLIFLSKGLAIILAFIGVKMIFEALHGVGVDFIGPYHVPEVSLEFSLAAIVTALIITTVASLTATRGIAGAE